MNNSVYILEDRAILYVNGSDAKDFLQNLISNDINKVTDNSSCFASLFTPQGKFLYEFMVVKHKLGYFIDCEKSQSEDIFKQLNLYKIRSKYVFVSKNFKFGKNRKGSIKTLKKFENIYNFKTRDALEIPTFSFCCKRNSIFSFVFSISLKK